MAEDKKKKKNVFQRIAGFFKDVVDWVEETFSDPAIATEVREDLGMNTDNPATPKATDTVTTHYKGTLLDGTTFDSSYERGEPASFPVNGVIKGWTEALQKMKVGSKWQLFIPGNLAYGANPRPGGPIGPNATLLFDIELLEVK